MSPACPQISLSEYSQENACLKCQRLWKYHSVFYQVLSCQAVSNQKMSILMRDTHNPSSLTLANARQSLCEYIPQTQ